MQQPYSHFKYRPDIDGLRGLAVFIVIIFHAFPLALQAGFIGVDIFFTISGFLITKIILKEWCNDNFFKEFYTRRIRRLFPALLIVLVSCFIFGWYSLFDYEFEQLSKHIIGGTAFISNFILWSEVGYFDNLAETKPLLHLWSLGIEEQFYLAWPLILYLCLKMRIKALYPTLTIILISFIMCMYSTQQDFREAFYSPLSRLWEILLGGFLAILIKEYGKEEKVGSGILSFLGLFLLATALIIIPKSTSFPGPAALLPTLGTALLLWTDNSWINQKLLSNRVLVALGLISYPLYLWHWPILSFSRIISEKEPSVLARSLLITFSIFLAWLTYRFVERPIRFHSARYSSVLGLLAVMISFCFLSTYTFMGHGVKDRKATDAKKNQFFIWKAKGSLDGLCLPDNTVDRLACKITDPDKPPSIVILGDSHAEHFFSGLSKQFEDKKENLLKLSRYGCLPFWGIVDSSLNAKNCRVLMDAAWDFIISTRSITTVILAHRFVLNEISLESQPSMDNISVYKYAFSNTLNRLIQSNKKIIYIFPIPELSFHPQSCLLEHPPLRKISRCSIELSLHKAHQLKIKEAAELILKKFPTVTVFYPDKYLCDEKECWAEKDGKLLYTDNHHLSFFGSLWIAEKFMKEFEARSRQE